MRFRQTANGAVPFTAEEEAQRDAEEAQWAAEQLAFAALEYQRKRKAEYPPVADYLDGIVKGDAAQVKAYIDACLAIKAKYPKT